MRQFIPQPGTNVQIGLQDNARRQGRIKLRLVRAGAASARFPNSFMVTSPTRQGWQTAAGGRFRGRRRNDHRTREPKRIASWGDARPARAQVRTSLCPRLAEDWPAMALAPFLGAGSQIRLPGGRPSSPGPTTGNRLPTLPGWFLKMTAESIPVEWIARA